MAYAWLAEGGTWSPSWLEKLLEAPRLQHPEWSLGEATTSLVVVGVLGIVFSKRCRPSDVLRSVSAEPGFWERGTLRGHIKGKASPVSNGLGPSLCMHTRVRTHTRILPAHARGHHDL